MFGEHMLEPRKKNHSFRKTVARFSGFMEQRKTPAEILSLSQVPETDSSEFALLTALRQRGFSVEEIHALCKLHEWYQSGGSDRAPILYHLEFLRWLVASGNFER
jgi:hypothetical protein